MMNQSPLVSVCIPTYNGAEYLPAALASVAAQTYPNLEVVFSDDGSSDDTLDIIGRFAATAPFPVKVLRHRHTSLAGNWNTCVAHAAGQYIKFLFQDDVMRPDCVGKLVARAEADALVSLVFSSRDILFQESGGQNQHAMKIAASCGNLHAGWSNLRPLQDGRELLADQALLKGVWNKFGEPSIVLIRRQSLIDIGGFDPELSQLIDLDMWYRLCAIGKVAFVDEVLSSFRVHQDQLSVKNAISGKGSSDTIMFARKVMNSSYFRDLHPDTRRTLTRRARPPGWSHQLKLFRRRIKQGIKDLIAK